MTMVTVRLVSAGFVDAYLAQMMSNSRHIISEKMASVQAEVLGDLEQSKRDLVSEHREASRERSEIRDLLIRLLAKLENNGRKH